MIPRQLSPQWQPCIFNVGPLECQHSITQHHICSIEAKCSSWCVITTALASAFNKEYAIYRVEERLVHSLPITHKEISYTTRVDPALSRASEFVKQGWPQHVEDLHLQPLFTCRFQLSVEQDCLPWGLRVIIPTQLSCLQISVVINAIH